MKKYWNIFLPKLIKRTHKHLENADLEWVLEDVSLCIL